MEKKLYLLVTFLITILVLFFFRNRKNNNNIKLFETDTIFRKTIKEKIITSGTISIKNTIKIGSIISGVADTIHVAENQHVKKGQLLITINTGTEDTDLKIAKYDYKKSLHAYKYKKSNFIRMQKIFNNKQISQDEFENIRQLYLQSYNSYLIKKEKYKKEQHLISLRKITAPQNGIITQISISQGSSISGADVTSKKPLMLISPNINNMEAFISLLVEFCW
jgi:multidrug efflux pump subunit AcrA (membrane-fusion protein)